MKAAARENTRATVDGPWRTVYICLIVPLKSVRINDKLFEEAAFQRKLIFIRDSKDDYLYAKILYYIYKVNKKLRRFCDLRKHLCKLIFETYY